MEVDGVLKLCHIGPSLITQRGKGSDHTIITQTFECHLVFRLSQPVKVPACKMKAMKLQTSDMVSHIIHAILLSFRQDKFPAITAGLHKKDRLGTPAMLRIYNIVANLTCILIVRAKATQIMQRDMQVSAGAPFAEGQGAKIAVNDPQ